MHAYTGDVLAFMTPGGYSGRSGSSDSSLSHPSFFFLPFFFPDLFATAGGCGILQTLHNGTL